MEKKFRKGSVFYLWKGLGKPFKCHVCAVVDGNMIVYKWYGRHKQWWHYEVEYGDLLLTKLWENETGRRERR